MKTLNWVILLVAGLSLTSMTARASFMGKEENDVERFMNADTIKYILFKSESDMKNSVFRSYVPEGDITGFAFFNKAMVPGTILFTTKFEVPSVTKSKAFLATITYMDWDVVKESLTKEEGKKLREYFLDRCG